TGIPVCVSKSCRIAWAKTASWAQYTTRPDASGEIDCCPKCHRAVIARASTAATYQPRSVGGRLLLAGIWHFGPGGFVGLVEVIEVALDSLVVAGRDLLLQD